MNKDELTPLVPNMMEPELPLYDVQVPCGEPASCLDVLRTEFNFYDYCGANNSSVLMAYAKGDSMYPEIMDGDIMIIRETCEPENGELVVVAIDDELDLTAKRIYYDEASRTLTLVPTNKEYQNIVINTMAHKVKTIGVVIRVLRNIEKKHAQLIKLTKPGNAEQLEGVVVNASINVGSEQMVAEPKKLTRREQAKADREEAERLERATEVLGVRRDIEWDMLASYFKATFKGAGRYMNYFEENLKYDLSRSWNAKQWATIANMIYESGLLAAKPDSFMSWYREFCNIMLCEFKPNTRPSRLIPSETMKNIFYYLKNS